MAVISSLIWDRIYFFSETENKWQTSASFFYYSYVWVLSANIQRCVHTGVFSAPCVLAASSAVEVGPDLGTDLKSDANHLVTLIYSNDQRLRSQTVMKGFFSKACERHRSTQIRNLVSFLEQNGSHLMF